MPDALNSKNSEPSFSNADYRAHLLGLADSTADPSVKAALTNYALLLERVEVCLAHGHLFIPTDAMRSILTHGHERRDELPLTFDDYLLSARFYKEHYPCQTTTSSGSPTHQLRMT